MPISASGPLCLSVCVCVPLSPSGGRAAVHQARQDPEADASGDHRRGADQQERGLGRTGLGQLVLALALLGRLVADRVGVGVVGALGAV
nr:hypothetical protein [Streptomyces sp. NBC_01257]